MPIFQIQKENLEIIREKKIGFESELQSLTEKNLDKIFGLDFVATEFRIKNFRIDTLSFDEETKSFVIIEYKRDRSFSVIDQGYAYLGLMINNKADFILEYNEKKKQKLSRDDIDWSQSRVLFLANDFTPYQRAAVNFKDLPIELWEVKNYENGLILFNQIESAEAGESIKTVTKDQTIQAVSDAVKKYTVEDHFTEGREKSLEIYEAFKKRIMDFDSRIVENPKKYYIGFKIAKQNMFDINSISKSKINLALYRVKPSDLKDPEQRTVYRKNCMQYYNKHISDFELKSTDDIDYAVSLARQVYEKYFK